MIFPGVGHAYLVDFGTWRVQLYFPSISELVYSPIDSAGQVGPGQSVFIEIDQVRQDIFIVRWLEADSTVVIHIEDFSTMKIYSNIVNPDLSISVFVGVFVQAP